MIIYEKTTTSDPGCHVLRPIINKLAIILLPVSTTIAADQGWKTLGF